MAFDRSRVCEVTWPGTTIGKGFHAQQTAAQTDSRLRRSLRAPRGSRQSVLCMIQCGPAHFQRLSIPTDRTQRPPNLALQGSGLSIDDVNDMI